MPSEREGREREEDLIEKLTARMREEGVQPKVDPRMSMISTGSDAHAAYLTFFGPEYAPLKECHHQEH